MLNVDVALRARYGELTPLEPGPEGPHYAAALPDGTPVVVVALGSTLGAAIRDGDAFARHLKHVATVRHDEIDRVLAWGCEQGTYHCGYARGDVRDAEPGAHRSTEVAAIGARLARALHAAHRSGLTHGSIATHRIRLAADGSPRLTAFGLVPALIASGIPPRAVYAQLCDSLYLSPEQQAGDAPSAQSDVYSLGAALYELLTGKPPFGGRTTSYVMATVLPEEPTSGPSQTTTADVVIHALLRAIEHEPQDRWPNAYALADALAAASAPHAARGAARATGGGVSGLRARFAAILQGAWFRPDGRGSDPEESPGSTGQTAR